MLAVVVAPQPAPAPTCRPAPIVPASFATLVDGPTLVLSGAPAVTAVPPLPLGAPPIVLAVVPLALAFALVAAHVTGSLAVDAPAVVGASTVHAIVIAIAIIAAAAGTRPVRVLMTLEASVERAPRSGGARSRTAHLEVDAREPRRAGSRRSSRRCRHCRRQAVLRRRVGTAASEPLVVGSAAQQVLQRRAAGGAAAGPSPALSEGSDAAPLTRRRLQASGMPRRLLSEAVRVSRRGALRSRSDVALSRRGAHFFFDGSDYAGADRLDIAVEGEVIVARRCPALLAEGLGNVEISGGASRGRAWWWSRLSPRHLREPALAELRGRTRAAGKSAARGRVERAERAERADRADRRRRLSSCFLPLRFLFSVFGPPDRPVVPPV